MIGIDDISNNPKKFLYVTLTLTFNSPMVDWYGVTVTIAMLYIINAIPLCPSLSFADRECSRALPFAVMPSPRETDGFL